MIAAIPILAVCLRAALLILIGKQVVRLVRRQAEFDSVVSLALYGNVVVFLVSKAGFLARMGGLS